MCWKGKPVQIAQISGIKYSFGHIDVELAHCGSGFIERHDIKSISPIAITPEILLMNGFKRNEMYLTTDFEWAKDGVDIYITTFDGDIVVDMENNFKEMIGANRLHHCEIKYVHQLQQAMRLCGIEKEIILN